MNLKNIFKSQKDFFYADTTIPINFRLIHLSKFKKALLENENEIYKAMYKDLGKSKEDAFVSEFAPCIKEIDFFLKNLNLLSKPEKIKTSLSNFKSKGYIYKKPFGVCLIVSTWNYPLLLSLVPMIGALAAGNTCILKLHPFSKHTNEIINKILSSTFEQCYVKSIDGDKEVLDSLLEFNFDYMFATGSPNIGKYVYSKAAEKLIPVTLELGGKNPCIVHSDANIKLACKRIVHGKFLNVGQTCLATDYIWVHHNIKDEFIKTLIETIEEMYTKDPLNCKYYSKIINELNFNRLTNIIDSLKDKIIFGGKYSKDSLKISPTIIDIDDLNSELLEGEIFGPILQIKSYEMVDDVIYSLKHTEPSLALYLFSENKALINKCLEIPFGGGCVNDTLLHVSEQGLPFGGFKNSGIGNYHGKHSFDTFTHKKSILMKSTQIEINSRYPNNKNYTLKKLKSIFKVKTQ